MTAFWTALRETLANRELCPRVSSQEGLPEVPQPRPRRIPVTHLLGPAFSTSGLFDLGSTQVPPLPPSTSSLPAERRFRGIPHLDRVWDRFCSSDVNGGAGVLSWQGIGFLLNRL